MSPIDAFEQSSGKTPQTAEERLERFREELTTEIESLKADWSVGPDELRVLNSIKLDVFAGQILGIAETIIKKEPWLNFRAVNQAVEAAHRRAIQGTYFVEAPQEYEDPFHYEPPKREKQKELSERERFYKEFRMRIGNMQGKIGHKNASIREQTKARAIGFATNFPDGDPTIERIGKRLIAWHKGQIKGEETNKIDRNTAGALFQIAKEALESAEARTGHSTKEHIKEATRHTITFLEGFATDDNLDHFQKGTLRDFRNSYPAQAQEYTAIDVFNRMKRNGMDAEKEPLEAIIKDAIAQANEQIDTPEADPKAEFTAGAQGTDLEPANDQANTFASIAGHKISAEIIAASREMADPTKVTALMDAMRGGPLEEEEPSFIKLLGQEMEKINDQLSTQQIALFTLLKENGCLNRSDILDLANKLYRSGGIEREEAEDVVEVATKIWAAEARRLEYKHGFPTTSLDERPGGVD